MLNPEQQVIADMLAVMIEQAKREGKWLWCHYQDLWFSPAKLEAENANGKFLWGPVNWELRDPQERLDEAKKRLAGAQKNVDRIAAEIAAPSTTL